MKDQGSNTNAQQLASQFLDGAINFDQEWQQLIQDSEAKSALERYQLASGLLKGEAVLPNTSIADAVMAELDKEATVLAPRRNSEEPAVETEVNASSNVIGLPRKVARMVGGFAIAASVAAVALINTNSLVVSSGEQTRLANKTVANPVQPQIQPVTIDVNTINSTTLPVIRTVSNQKAVAVTVTADDQKQSKTPDDGDQDKQQDKP